jgi:hypothetical protein
MVVGPGPMSFTPIAPTRGAVEVRGEDRG